MPLNSSAGKGKEMFEKFGEMDYQELDTLVHNLWNEGDKESLQTLCKENGLEYSDIEDAAADGVELWVTPRAAALGRVKVQEEELKPKGLMNDWISYIRVLVLEDPEMQVAVSQKRKTLAGCIGALLKWSFGNQWTVPEKIKKAAGVNGKVTFGVPDMGQAKKIIREYYGGRS